jgi:hypothetical protein
MLNMTARRGCRVCECLLEGISLHLPATDLNKLHDIEVESSVVAFRYLGNVELVSFAHYNSGTFLQFLPRLKETNRCTESSTFEITKQKLDHEFDRRDHNISWAPLTCTSHRLKHCLEKHPDCGPANWSCTNHFPKRIIEVQPLKVVLREYVPVNQRAPYACLSYCWGTPQLNLRTIVSNLQDFLCEIPWEGIPKTVQDAITICRRLDIWFLWVDALCIIQDSVWDKHDQLAGMADIYGGSLVTIAAEKAESSAAGIFAVREEDQKRLVRDPAVVCFQHSGGGINYIDQRGWTFQELELASRVIRFETVWVSFTCQALTKPHMMRPGNPNEAWNTMVQRYSGRKLSFETDSLLALSGLAERMLSRRPQEVYLAGIWSGNLVNNLCWYAKDVQVMPIERQAPSWSWASVNSGISFALIEGNDIKANATATYVTNGQANLGRYDEAKVEFDGHVTLASLGQRRRGHSHYGLDIRLSLPKPMTLMADYYFKALPDEQKIDNTTELLLCGLCASGYDAMYFLVLRKAMIQIDGKQDVYERIGLAHWAALKAERRLFENMAQRRKILII